MPILSANDPQPQEEWRPVVGYEGVYSVSNLGRVRRDVGGQGTHANIILSPATRNKTGYLFVSLGMNGKKTSFSVHSLVAAAFLGPRPNGHVVHHKDDNRANPVLSNLEYVTKAANSWLAPQKHPGETSAYRGVHLCGRSQRFIARIKHNNVAHWLGYFDDEVAAAHAYDDACRRLRGKAARLNFPNKGEMAA